MGVELTDWDTQYKIIYDHSTEDLDFILSRLVSSRKKVVFTNGCFDIIHVGHIELLETARSWGGYLIVGLNSDESVKKIKPNGRPVVPEDQRARVLASLACVDLVVLFEEPTPLSLIFKIKPDILVKGADWRSKEVIGGQYVQYYGGEVKFVEFASSTSTSAIIYKILTQCK